MHNPQNNLALQRGFDLRGNNFVSLPDHRLLTKEFNKLRSELNYAGIKTIELTELLSKPSDIATLHTNPNAMFVRDPIITLPWDGSVAILSNMTLLGRKQEPAIAKIALQVLGCTTFFEVPPHLPIEGGDVIAASIRGKRTLFIGIGTRTSMKAAQWLTATLTPQYVDQIICFAHNESMLHLDTCFALLPNTKALCARNALHDAWIFNEQVHTPDPVRAISCLDQQGIEIIWVSQDDAANDEDTNMLFVGDDTYLTFNISAKLKSALERKAGIRIIEIAGSEITKANGGIHCLTRPIY